MGAADLGSRYHTSREIPANPSKNRGVLQSQGAWEMEGDMMKGKFTRKDNNKVLTTTRILEGGEMVQVSAAGIILPNAIIAYWCVLNPTKINKPPHLLPTELQLRGRGLQEDF